MTQTITTHEIVNAEESHEAPRQTNTRLRVLVGTAVAIAATLFALAVDEAPATVDSQPQIASQLRWEGIAAAFGPDHPKADQLRWERLAEHVQSEATRRQTAQAARWEALADYHNAR